MGLSLSFWIDKMEPVQVSEEIIEDELVEVLKQVEAGQVMIVLGKQDSHLS